MKLSFREGQSLKYNVGGTRSYWVSPSYELFEIGNIEHSEWISERPEYRDFVKKNFGKPSFDIEQLLEKAANDGWSRIAFWPFGMKGSWFAIKIGEGADVYKVLSIIPEEIHAQEVLIEDVGQFPQGEDSLPKAYQRYVRRKHLVSSVRKSVVNPEPWQNRVEIELSCANSNALGKGEGEKVYQKWLAFNKKYGNIIKIGDPEEESEDFYKEGSIFCLKEEVPYFLNLLKKERIKPDILHEGREETKL